LLERSEGGSAGSERLVALASAGEALALRLEEAAGVEKGRPAPRLVGGGDWAMRASEHP